MNKFLSVTSTFFVIVNSGKDKDEALKEYILKNLIPRGFNARIAEIKEEYHQPTAQLKQAIKDCANRTQALQYDNVGLKGKIRAKDHEIAFLERRYLGYLTNEDKSNGITIIAKSNKATGSLYIFTYRHHGYRRHKIRVMLPRN